MQKVQGNFAIYENNITTIPHSFSFLEFNDAFIANDSHRKGYLTKKEVTKTMRKIGYNPTDADCQNIELEIAHKSKFYF